MIKSKAKSQEAVQESVPTTWNWVKIDGRGTIPEPRYGHTLLPLFSSAQLLLLGGSDQVAFSNELFTFSYDTNTWELEKTNIPNDDADNTTFPKRHFHTSVLYREDMYIFGGKSNGYFNDLWKYTPSSKIWTKQNYSTGTKPPVRRYGHSMIIAEDALWLYGGFDADSMICDDLWKYDFKDSKWTAMKPKKEKPVARMQHTAVLDGENKEMLVFGGLGDEGVLSDLWAYNFKKNKWREIPAPEGITTLKQTKNANQSMKTNRNVWPTPRYGHASIIPQPGMMYVYGGYNKSEGLAEFYAYSIRTGKWYLLNAVGKFNNKAVPKATYFHSLTGAKDMLTMFGGRSTDGSPYNEMWVLRPARSSSESLSLLNSISRLGTKRGKNKKKGWSVD